MSTRAQLRRAIGVITGQPFFRRYGAAPRTATGGTTTTIVDNLTLWQELNYWVGAFAYLPTTDEVRPITAYTPVTWTVTWLELATAVVAGTLYEIWTQYTPHEVHQAINEALRKAWPFFFTVNELPIVIRSSFGVDYALAAASPAVRKGLQLWMEHSVSSVTGISAGGVAINQLRDTNAAFVAADIGMSIRIYGGTSAGDIRTVTAIVNPTTIQVGVNFTVILTTTSLYRMVDLTAVTSNYQPVRTWDLDKLENPTLLRLTSHPAGYEGCLLRFAYEAEMETLAAEATNTVCPDGFVIPAALSWLMMVKMGSTPAEYLESWAAQQRAFSADAADYARTHAFQHLPTFIQDESAFGGHGSDWPF